MPLLGRRCGSQLLRGLWFGVLMSSVGIWMQTVSAQSLLVDAPKPGRYVWFEPCDASCCGRPCRGARDGALGVCSARGGMRGSNVSAEAGQA
jgi:hypothetical protein